MQSAFATPARANCAFAHMRGFPLFSALETSQRRQSKAPSKAIAKPAFPSRSGNLSASPIHGRSRLFATVLRTSTSPRSAATVVMSSSFPAPDPNTDPRTVRGFGAEWARFDQSEASGEDLQALFEAYFRIFPKEFLRPDRVGVDIGCGSGRWAKFVAPVVGKLICVDASPEALEVARRNLAAMGNVEFVHASVSALPLPEGAVDFAFSLGALHHIPDTAAGIRDSVRVLKPGCPLLVYLYYNFENRPAWYGIMWKVSDIARRLISATPFALRRFIADILAVGVYWPLARAADLGERLGFDVHSWPLSYYRRRGLYTMRTDALDRFGTTLERRFSRMEVAAMMEAAGLERVVFSDAPPFWCAVGFKKAR
jgi:SAM-dependent methyltransferase